MNERRPERLPLAAALLLAQGLWVVVFVWRPAPFWFLLTSATALLGLLGLWDRRKIPFCSPSPGRLGLAALSAPLLYLIFWSGNHLLLLLESYELLPFARQESLLRVYAGAADLPSGVLLLLLAFPIGWGEELFWRGLIQQRMARLWGPDRGWLAASLVYTLVHLPTQNPLLLVASLVCGLFWGGLYRYGRGQVLLPLISHMLWDPLIFVILPLN